MMKKTNVKGFTLVELLIVIGILGVLAAAVVVVLNPAELLAQARDSQRLQDLAGLESAINFYLTATTTPDLNVGATGVIRIGTASTTCGGFTTNCSAVDTDRTVDGTGWVRVDFAELTGGSPLAVLPVDPTNSGTNQYAYAGDDANDLFELTTILESTKFATDEDLDGGDGGDDAGYYEKGNSLSTL